MSGQGTDKTRNAVERQLAAMGGELFEVGALQRGDGDKPEFMILRTWDRKRVVESIPWLLHQNWHDSHIYVRPKGESNLTLVDDLTLKALSKMRQEGFQPAAVVQTSPGNYQAWVKHAAPLDRELGTAVARKLAERFGGDVKAADWRHFGRLAGFRNIKTRYARLVPVPAFDEWRGQYFYRDLEGRWVDRNGNFHSDRHLRDVHAGLEPRVRFPFVQLMQASGGIARESNQLVTAERKALEQRRADQARRWAQFGSRAAGHTGGHLKGIEVFRADPRYSGDGTRVDLAYAVYAMARGVDAEDVRAALRSRDLSHKGSEKRQGDYVERTLKKAVASLAQGRGR